MAITYAFAGIAAADFEAMRAWYEQLVGRPPDLVPREGDVAWQLTETGWIYVVDDPDRAGGGLLTILVDDLEEQLAALEERGLTTGPIDTVPGEVKRAEITDPEGNRVTFAEAAGD